MPRLLCFVRRQGRKNQSLKLLRVALALLRELYNEVRNRGSRFHFVESFSVGLKGSPRFVEDPFKHDQRIGIKAVVVMPEEGHVRKTLGHPQAVLMLG